MKLNPRSKQHRDVKAKSCSAGNYVAARVINFREKTIFLIDVARGFNESENNGARTTAKHLAWCLRESTRI